MIQDKRFVSGRIKSIGFAVKGAIRPRHIQTSTFFFSAFEG